MTSLGWAAEAARVMQSQGWEDSYTILDTLLLKGGEYAAKYNLGYDVLYDRSFYRCEAILVKGPWAQPSEIKRGIVGSPKVWDVSYNTYLYARRSEFSKDWRNLAFPLGFSSKLTRPATLDPVLSIQRQERPGHPLHSASKGRFRRCGWRTTP